MRFGSVGLRRDFTSQRRVPGDDSSRKTVQRAGEYRVTDDRSPPEDATDGSSVSSGGQWLVALCGLPGVGKSTVAADVTERLGAVRLRTDVVRKELVDEPAYTESETDAVYRELCERAGERLADGESVVLDATFARGDHRERIRDLADRHAVEFRLVRVVCDQPVVERRIANRDDVSDADVDVYRRFKDEFEPVEGDHAVVDNSGEEAETRAQIDTLF